LQTLTKVQSAPVCGVEFLMTSDFIVEIMPKGYLKMACASILLSSIHLGRRIWNPGIFIRSCGGNLVFVF